MLIENNTVISGHEYISNTNMLIKEIYIHAH